MTGQTFPIALATAADVPAILAIMTAAHQAMAVPDRYITDDEAYVVAHIVQQGVVLLAYAAPETPPAKRTQMSAGDPVAFLMLHFPAADAENHLGRAAGLPLEAMARTAHMDSAAVLPQWQGHGLQRQLLLAAEPLLAQMGYRHLCGTVAPDNTPSVRSFLACGYVVAATVEKYGGLRRHVMYKALDS